MRSATVSRVPETPAVMEPSRRLRVVYVVGSSHSGSTLLAMLANQHPAVASVGETAIKRRIRTEGRTSAQLCSCGAALPDCRFWRAVFADVSGSSVRFDVDDWSVDYRFEAAWLDALLTRETSVSLLRRARHRLTRTLPGLRSRMRRVDRANMEFFRAVLTLANAHVFVDTSKLVTRLTYLLDLADLDLRVVHLVRDPRGVAASAARRGGSALHAARVWAADQRVIASTLHNRPAVPRLTLRYEDVCREPQQGLSGFWSFCGVEPSDAPSTLTPGDHHVLGNKMRLKADAVVRLDDAWRSSLAPDVEAAVWGITGSASTRLGYQR